ncbi:prepilin peptidase [Paenibacillus puerhi]|uniref:prepilin peptidase n=1 Tax=Paenibacillus puerhi TaxID=2692622 RepID=UPI00135B2816|nr:A24 family peptidase [Paenibacillus puerhi]
METAVALSFAAVLGLLIGSFLNVVALRSLSGESLAFPPSHCTSCSHRLRPLDLVPVFSYAGLRGRCRYCHNRISIQYPIVEAATGLLYALMIWAYGVSWEAAVGMLFVSILMAIVVTDLRAMLIPNRILLFGLAGALVLRLISHPLPWWHYAAGMIGGLLLIVGIALLGSLLLRKEAMGMGDAKLFALVGLVLGWKLTLLTLFVASLLGTIFGVFWIMLKRTGREAYLPFGPFIALASVLCMLAGDAWIDWYVSLLS